MRILVIDDEELILRVIWRSLREHAVDVATSPAAGLALHTAEPYPLAFVDVKLPGSNGPTLAAALMAVHPLRVVLMSGDLGLLDDSPAGCVTLDKPFTMAELVACVAGEVHSEQEGTTP